jgi:hypothetical protein
MTVIVRCAPAPVSPASPAGTTPPGPLGGTPLARICCPVSPAIHPAAAELNEQTLSWLRGYGLYADAAQLRRLECAQPGLLAARVVPAGEPEPMAVFTDFHTWLFAFDDEYCDERAPSAMPAAEWSRFLARLARQAETGSDALLPGNRYALALGDISRRLARHCTPAQHSRWCSALRAYFTALIWETHSRSQGEPGLSAADYTLLRLHNGAMGASIALLDLAEGYELPCSVRERADVRALAEMTAILVSWDNDIFSWPKEHDHVPGQQQNLLDALAASHPDPLAQAVRLRNGVMELFTVLAGPLTATADSPVSRFVTSLGHWVRANLDFSTSTARYAEPGRQIPADWPATVPAGWAASPLGYPALAWWAELTGGRSARRTHST